MKTKDTPYGPGLPIRETPAIIGNERSKNGSKPTIRFPDKPLGCIPGGSDKTSGPFKRALTPGTTPTGS